MSGTSPYCFVVVVVLGIYATSAQSIHLRVSEDYIVLLGDFYTHVTTLTLRGKIRRNAFPNLNLSRVQLIGLVLTTVCP